LKIFFILLKILHLFMIYNYYSIIN